MISKCQTEPCLTWIDLFSLMAFEQQLFFVKQELSSFQNDRNAKLMWTLNRGLKNNESYSSFSVSMTSISVYSISKLLLHFSPFLFLFIWRLFLVSAFVSLFRCEDDQTVKQVAQRGCEVPSLGDIQSPMHTCCGWPCLEQGVWTIRFPGAPSDLSRSVILFF